MRDSFSGGNKPPPEVKKDYKINDIDSHLQGRLGKGQHLIKSMQMRMVKKKEEQRIEREKEIKAKLEATKTEIEEKKQAGQKLMGKKFTQGILKRFAKENEELKKELKVIKDDL